MLALLTASEVVHDRWWGPGPWLLLLWLPLWFLVIRALWFRRGGRHDGLSVLADRYARGEIDDTEYHARRATLRGRS
ncbi:MAG: hypothetical protein K0R11_1855 [Acidimicrobiales bacterium]|jgi:putative membrane protein|nr:hypothetical protein [Acidimicrobiales bacterium]